jgi:hypothetical protein
MALSFIEIPTCKSLASLCHFIVAKCTSYVSSKFFSVCTIASQHAGSGMYKQAKNSIICGRDTAL